MILFYNYCRITGSFLASFGQNNAKNCDLSDFKQNMPKFVHCIIFVFKNLEILSNNIMFLAKLKISEGFIVSF